MENEGERNLFFTYPKEENTGYWGFSLFFQWHGSVANRSVWVAALNGILAMIMHQAVHKYLSNELHNFRTDGDGFQIGIGGYFSVMGFLLVFRTQQAESRASCAVIVFGDLFCGF